MFLWLQKQWWFAILKIFSRNIWEFKVTSRPLFLVDAQDYPVQNYKPGNDGQVAFSFTGLLSL